MGRWIESCPNGLTAAELGDAVEALATTKAKVFGVAACAARHEGARTTKPFG
jgi:hypothetical protein